MAEKRMFTKKITDSDPFTEMPLSAQALYFHLNMHADDDGFVNAPKKISRSIGASEDDLKLLIAKRFLLAFDNGVVAVKHWLMHNTLKKDRYKETQYKEQRALLAVKDNKSYTESENVSTLEPEWNQNGTELEPQYSIDKDSIDKYSVDKVNKENTKRKTFSADVFTSPKKYGEYCNVILTDEEYEKLQLEFPEDYEKRIETLSSYIASTGKKYENHLATIKNWASKEMPKPKTAQTSKAGGNPFLTLAMEGDEQ